MNKNASVCLVAALAVTLAGCQTGNDKPSFLDNKCETLGTLVGGVAGGLLGARFGKGDGRILAVLAGVAAGAVMGNKIGGLLDCEDQKAAAAAVQVAAATGEVGEKVYWRSTTAPEVAEPVVVPSTVENAAKATPAPAPAPAPAPTPVKAAPKAKPVTADAKSGAKMAKSATSAPQTPSDTTLAPAETKPAIVSAGTSGSWGWVEPVGGIYSKGGQLCRDLRQVVVAPDGKKVDEQSTSCQTADGKWLNTQSAGMG